MGYSFGQAIQSASLTSDYEFRRTLLGTLLYGIRPRLEVVATYGILGASFAWGLFGAQLKAPRWALGPSAFHHVAPAPAEGFQVVSALVIIGVGVVAAAAGVVLFQRRDLEG